MLNARIFSEKLIPRQIIDGDYPGAIELGFESRNYSENNNSTTNNVKTNNNSRVLNESKSTIIKYMELMDLISEKENELNELYKEQREMENSLIADPTISNLLHKVNENVSKRTIK